MGGMVKSEATGNMVFGLGNVVQRLGHLIHQPVCNSDRSVRGIGGAVLWSGLGLGLYGWYLLCILFQLSFRLGEGKIIRWESETYPDDNS